jgi:hypothetical protein
MSVVGDVEPFQERPVRGVQQPAVMRLDHADARTHDPSELVHRDSSRERVRGERRA